jgi:hypothetical protein
MTPTSTPAGSAAARPARRQDQHDPDHVQRGNPTQQRSGCHNQQAPTEIQNFFQVLTKKRFHDSASFPPLAAPAPGQLQRLIGKVPFRKSIRELVLNHVSRAIGFFLANLYLGNTHVTKLIVEFRAVLNHSITSRIVLDE